MATRRMFLPAVIAAVILIVSCAAPAAPPTAPTQSAPQPVPTQPVALSAAPAPTNAPTAVITKAAPPTVTSSPTAATQPTATTPPTAASAAPPRAPTQTVTAKLNMDEIFPPGPGRDVVLNNCTTCHTIVPLVVLQYGQAQWDNSARNHRDRVPRLSDADFKAAYAYLAKNFNPDHPVPKLPQDLLDTWTDY